jgi:hypothetical protein
MFKSWRYRHPKFLRCIGNYCNFIWICIILFLILTSTITTVIKGVDGLCATPALSLSYRTCFIFYIVDTISSPFGPNTKGRHREIVYYSRNGWRWPRSGTPVGMCAALAIPPAPPPPDTKHKPRMATQGDFDKAMHSTCTYVLMLN